MKKILALLLVLALSLTLVACGSGSTTKAKASDYKVAMVTDYGDITDQSFNQTTWEAVVAFGKDNNVETKYYKPTSNDTAGRVASVELAIAEGYNVIVMPGYAFGGTIVEVAPNYPDVKFVALDVAKGDLLETAVANKGESYDYNPDNWKLEDYVDLSNVYCAIYQEELSGYMAGYAAVKLGYTVPKALEAVTFADNASISSWAKEAVESMQQAGILAGKANNRFNPKGTAVRAEVATVLRRFVEIVIDPQTANGWQQNDSGEWSYYKNGEPLKGWFSVDQKKYWMDKTTGKMFSNGWKQIDGKWYYFYPDGAMAVNTTIDGYTIGSDGARK